MSDLTGGSGSHPDADAGEHTDASVALADAREDTSATADAPNDTAAPDAGGDAPNQDAADASGFCPSLHATATFCADFDESGSYAAGWTSPDLTGSGALSLDSSSSVSAPNSLHATAGPGAASTTHASLTTTLPGAMTSTHVEAAVRITRLGAPAVSIVDLGQSDPNGRTRHVELYFDGSGPYIQEDCELADGGASFMDYRIAGAVTPSEWHTYAFDLTGTSMSISVDGSITNPSITLLCPWLGTANNLSVGISYIYQGSVSGVDLSVDNVVVTLK